LAVSKLGFGEFDFGAEDPYHLGPKEGWQILTEAFKLGVNFWDSTDDYDTHPNAAHAMRHLPRKELVISFKTNAKDPESALRSLNSYLLELGTDYIDVLMLHCVDPDWKGYPKMLKELSRMKETGLARAIGLSTHSVKIIRRAAQVEEVDVILTICCKASPAVIDKFISIEDGTIEEMYDAIRMPMKREREQSR
jgi:aryl-alcohol dehydrogenase-like predicted oxidoreductase